MALERPKSASDMMGEGMELEDEAVDEAVADSIDIPLTIIGEQEVEPGDVVRLEVVSVDNDNGVIKVKYAQPEESPEEEKSIEGLASAFD